MIFDTDFAAVGEWVNSKFALITQAGYKVDLEINNNTFVITPKLYDKNNNLISTGTGVDLPLESVVVNGSYDNTNQKIVLTLKNGNTVDIPVSGLVSGLYSKPSTGIPKTDLSSAVQTSLGKADTALQEHQDVSGKANKSEMSVTSGTGTATIQLKTGTSVTVLTEHQDISGKADKPTTTTVTIATTDWSNLTCTKSVTGMTASKIVLVSPAPASFTAYTDAGVRCSAQGSGTLSFACDSVPSASVTVNILILG